MPEKPQTDKDAGSKRVFHSARFLHEYSRINTGQARQGTAMHARNPDIRADFKHIGETNSGHFSEGENTVH